MKRVFPFALVFITLAACKNAETDVSKATADTSAAKPDYAYTIERPDGWERGDVKNSVLVLKSLKAYENGNVDECVSYFGDSVELKFDEYEQKLSNDSLKAFLTRSRDGRKSIQIKMEDWESVISSDKTLEYVSLWYKQIEEDKAGKKDSLFVMDDLRVKDGKIVSIDEKSRKYAAKKI